MRIHPILLITCYSFHALKVQKSFIILNSLLLDSTIFFSYCGLFRGELPFSSDLSSS